MITLHLTDSQRLIMTRALTAMLHTDPANGCDYAKLIETLSGAETRVTVQRTHECGDHESE